MVKLIALVKRKDGMTLEEFSRYWREHHGPLAISMLPGVKRYVQNHAVRLASGGDPQIDGVVELWFDDLEAQRRCAAFWASDEGKPIRDDEERFIDRSKMIFFVAEEKVIKE